MGAVAMAKSRRAPADRTGKPGFLTDKEENLEAGQLTAGEWNDLHNWDAWKDLLADKDYTEMETHWDLYPNNRYSVFVRNKYELPIQDARVEMLDAAGNVLWTARTDNSGHVRP